MITCHIHAGAILPSQQHERAAGQADCSEAAEAGRAQRGDAAVHVQAVRHCPRSIVKHHQAPLHAHSA